MIKTQFFRNNGFSWFTKDNIQCKGYYNLYGKYYEKLNLPSVWTEVRTEKDFISILNRINGCFDVIIETEQTLFCAVDRLRSFPLFYTIKNKTLYLSDDIYWIKNETNYKEINELNKEEFRLTGYVTGDETLVNNIYQLQAGEYIIWNKRNRNLEKSFYFEYKYKDFFKKDEEQLIEKLDKLHIKVFKRLIESLNGRQAVIPLSGGYDSRLIAIMLKRLNYKNILCFTYGREGNKESELSKQVANSLDLPWTFIPYTPKTWKDFLDKETTIEYIKYASNFVSSACIQDYPAIKYLNENNSIEKDAVIIPGHTYDFLQGGHLPLDLPINKSFTHKELYKEIIKKHYQLWRNNINKTAKTLHNKFTKELPNQSSDFNLIEFAETFEKWDLKERQGKFIVNSLRTYEVFDYEWRIPLWDNELINFWSKVPLGLKINRRLYINYVEKKYSKDVNFVFDKINDTNKRHLGNRAKYKLLQILFETNLYNTLKLGGLKKDCYNNNPMYNYHVYSYEHFMKYRKDAQSRNSFNVVYYLENFI